MEYLIVSVSPSRTTSVHAYKRTLKAANRAVKCFKELLPTFQFKIYKIVI